VVSSFTNKARRYSCPHPHYEGIQEGVDAQLHSLLILALDGHLHALAALPPGKTPEPTEHSAGWVPKSYWTFRRKENSPVPLGVRILHHLNCSLFQGCTNV